MWWCLATLALRRKRPASMCSCEGAARTPLAAAKKATRVRGRMFAILHVWDDHLEEIATREGRHYICDAPFYTDFYPDLISLSRQHSRSDTSRFRRFTRKMILGPKRKSSTCAVFMAKRLVFKFSRTVNDFRGTTKRADRRSAHLIFTVHAFFPTDAECARKNTHGKIMPRP